MHMEYEVLLAHHNLVVASKDKLVPSVYTACEIQPTSARCQPKISYTGPLNITTCSLKHESYTAFTHGQGFGHVLKLEEFASVAKNRVQVKPNTLALVDGGPNENP